MPATASPISASLIHLSSLVEMNATARDYFLQSNFGTNDSNFWFVLSFSGVAL